MQNRRIGSRGDTPWSQSYLGLRDAAALVLLLMLIEDERIAEYSRPIFVPSGRKRQRPPTLALRISFFVMAFGLARQATAQVPQVVVPTDLFKAEAGDGLRLSPGLILYPATTADIAYDSNIYNISANKRDDGLAIVRPDLLLATDLGRHGLELRGSGEIRRYLRIKAENSETYQIHGLGRFDLGERLQIVPQVGLARRIELRGTAGDQFQTDKPITYREKRAALRIARSGARLEASVEGAIIRSKFTDASFGGLAIDLSDRDVTTREARLRASLSLSDRTRIFSEFGGTEVDYERRTTVDRDSSGYAILAGIHVQLTQLIDVQVAVGFIRQDFASSLYKPVSGLNYKLDAVWTPSPRWQIEAGAQRRINASPREDVPVIVQSEFRLKAVRVLGDRWKVEAGAIYSEERYESVARTDRRLALQANVHCRLSTKIGFYLGVGYRKQDGGASGRSYQGAAASVGTRIVL